MISLTLDKYVVSLIDLLDREQASSVLYDAFIYGKEGVIPEYDNKVMFQMFNLLKSEIDKKAKIREKRVISGRIGGLKKSENRRKSYQNVALATNSLKINELDITTSKSIGYKQVLPFATNTLKTNELDVSASKSTSCKQVLPLATNPLIINELDEKTEENHETEDILLYNNINNNINNINNINNNNINTIDKNKKEKLEKEKRKTDDYDYSQVPLPFLCIIQEWVAYKKERKERYKSQRSFNAMVKKWINLSDNSPEIARLMLEEAMANNWAGFFKLKKEDYARRKNDIVRDAAELVNSYLSTPNDKVSDNESIF